MPPRKNPTMCAVQIGYQTVLMPAASGMKVVALLADAMDCNQHHDDDFRPVYEVGEPLSVQYKSVRPGQIRLPQRAQPRRLELLED